MMEPFYKNGLQFECARCSNCCRHDPGYVFLTFKDLKKLAAFLNINENIFKEKYCAPVSINGFNRLSLREKENYDCIFWEEKGCLVYKNRPLQCRSYPFWSPFLSEEKSWLDLKGTCSGINKGKLHSRKIIEKWLEERSNTDFIIL